MPRTSGYKGAIIDAVCFDRAVLAPMARRLIQRRRAFYDTLEHVSEAQGIILLNTHFRVAVGCSLHDMQSGLRWGLRPMALDGVLIDLHIAIEAARTS